MCGTASRQVYATSGSVHADCRAFHAIMPGPPTTKCKRRADLSGTQAAGVIGKPVTAEDAYAEKRATCRGTRRGRVTRWSSGRVGVSPVGVAGSLARCFSSTCSGTLNSHSVATCRHALRCNVF